MASSDKPRYRYNWKVSEWTTPNGVIISRDFDSVMLGWALDADRSIDEVKISAYTAQEKAALMARTVVDVALKVCKYRMQKDWRSYHA